MSVQHARHPIPGTDKGPKSVDATLWRHGYAANALIEWQVPTGLVAERAPDPSEVTRHGI